MKGAAIPNRVEDQKHGGDRRQEVELSSREGPETRARPPSRAESAMAANARSRDHQGKAEDKARREHHEGMARDVKERQGLGRRGERAARIGHGEGKEALRPSVGSERRSISDARQDASADERAVDEGMGEPRNPASAPSARR